MPELRDAPGYPLRREIVGAAAGDRCKQRGKPWARAADLAIAATVLTLEAVPLTRDYKDFKLVDDLVDVREPPA